MGGRNAQPVELILAKGKSHHLTKAEIDRREKAKISFGDNKLKCPDYVKNDVEAYKKWKEIIKLYKDVDFVSSGDTGLLARYCITFSEYQLLLQSKNKIKSFDVDWDSYEHLLPENIQEGIVKMFSLDPLLKIDNAINKKMDMLIKMEDRLFLNPLAKIKNVPKKEPEKPESKLQKAGFNI